MLKQFNTALLVQSNEGLDVHLKLLRRYVDVVVRFLVVKLTCPHRVVIHLDHDLHERFSVIDLQLLVFRLVGEVFARDEFETRVAPLAKEDHS